MREAQEAGVDAEWSRAYSNFFGDLNQEQMTYQRLAQVLNAFNTALDLYDAEGGQPARLARYTTNMRVLYDGVRALGLMPYLPPEAQGPIIVNVHAPDDPRWDLQGFVDALKRRGFLISNFYNTETPSFRVGCIGAITPEDMRRFVAAMGEVLAELGINRRRAA